MNLKNGNGIKGVLDGLLHVLNCLCSGGDAISSLGRAPVLFDEVKFAMVLGVKIT